MPTIRIMTVDDAKGWHEYVRHGIPHGVVDPSISIKVIQEVENGQDAIRYLEQCEGEAWPDVILMDIRFKERSQTGLAATKIITARYSVKVLICSQYDDLEYVDQAFQNLASGYFVKNTEEGINDLSQAIVRVWKGEYSVPQRILAKMVTLLTKNPTLLTPREREVANLYVQGKTNKDIADHLNCSVKVVETHITKIRYKLGASSREEVGEKLRARENATDQRRFDLTPLEMQVAKLYAQNRSVEEMADTLKMMLMQTILTDVQRKLNASSSAEVKSCLIEDGLLSRDDIE